MKKLFLLVIPILIWGTSCDRDPQTKEEEMADEEIAYIHISPKPGDVYVAGMADDKAVLWKNGVVQNLTNEHFVPQSVYVSGNDIYVAGYGEGTGKLWKNGVLQNLEGEAMAAWSVFVSGNDVYVAGEKFVRESYGFGGRGMPILITAAVLWKNGVIQYLTDGANKANATSVYVSGEDVYVTGFHNSPIVWKNGIEQKLSGGLHDNTTSVFVCGEDVYVAGFQHGANNTAMLWKNGIEQKLTDGNNATSVFVSNNDVYVAGYEYIAGRQVATVWKNGVAQRLADVDNNTYAHSIYISGNDVYVAGYEFIRYLSNEGVIIEDKVVVTVWKNGIAQKISDNGSYRAFSIFVVE